MGPLAAIVHTRKAPVEPAATETSTTAAALATMEPAKSAAAKSAAMGPATAAMESAASTPAVETTATAALASVGEIWRAQRGNAQQSSCRGTQSPAYPGAGSMFA